MQEAPDQLTDLEPVETKTFMGRKWRYSLFAILIIVSIAQIILSRMFFIRRLGSDELEILKATFFAVISALFSTPMMALIIASFISLIPIKPYSYKERFWPIVLVILLIIQSVAFLSGLYTWWVIPAG